MNPPFDLTKEEMKAYGYKIIDILAEHFDNLESKKPVSSATREEMDAVFLQEAPNEATPANEVLDFVMDNVIPYSNLQTHPKIFFFTDISNVIQRIYRSSISCTSRSNDTKRLISF